MRGIQATAIRQEETTARPKFPAVARLERLDEQDVQDQAKLRAVGLPVLWGELDARVKAKLPEDSMALPIFPGADRQAQSDGLDALAMARCRAEKRLGARASRPSAPEKSNKVVVAYS